MLILLLRRIEQSEEGTFGEIFEANGNIVAYTCERPNNGNQKMGCIPIGEYEVRQFDSPSKGRVFLLENVPNRSMIEIHKGNTIDDTEGCILVGYAFGQVNEKKAVTGSKIKLAAMLEKYSDPFLLRIIEDF